MKIGNFIITRDRTPRLDADTLKRVDEVYEKGLRSGKKLILGTLCARSGTMWLCDIFDAHENATGITERYFEAESFYRYIKYNNLPIDTAGIITIIKQGIIEDWKRGDIALVFSPYFSHGMKELDKFLRPTRIIFAINNPEFTVQSMYNKGLFKHHYIRDRVDLALGFQPAFPASWSYLFGRIVPNGVLYNTWNDMTRIGKVSWWGNRVLTDIWEQLKDMPKEKLYIFHLKDADQNYEYYKRMANAFGLSPLLSERKFLSLKGMRVRKAHNAKHEWSEKERAEFEEHTKEWKKLYRELCGI